MTVTQALSRRRTERCFTSNSIPRILLERLLWAAQGITDPEGRRTAPSAHALHPLRLFLVAKRIDGLGEGTYEVDPGDHSLTVLSRTDLLPALRKAAIDDPEWITDAACVVAICADMVAPGKAFAAQKPYGARGARYVYLEAGAAAQSLHLQAVAEGLGSVWVGGFDDGATARVLGLPDALAPILLQCVGYPTQTA